MNLPASRQKATTPGAVAVSALLASLPAISDNKIDVKGHLHPSQSQQRQPLSTRLHSCNKLSLRLVQNIGQVTGFRPLLQQRV